MVRLGIVGTGRIAKRFVTDAWQKFDVEIVAVYNPHEDSVRRFYDETNLEGTYLDWNSFVNQIDAAYVAAPTGTHFGYVDKLLQSGIHVLCEKPMVLSKKQAEYLYEMAEKKNCVLMEGIKTAYCPGFIAVLDIINQGKIGQVRDVEACFTKLVDSNWREWTHIEDCGSMTELGTYGCFGVTKILGCDFSDVRFTSIRNENGIDAYTKVFFEFGNDAVGLVKAGIGVKSEGELLIAGTKGYILVKAPWWLTKYVEVHYEDPTKIETYNYEYVGNGLQYELGYFLRKIDGEDVSDRVTKAQSIVIADIMQKFLEKEKIYRKN